MISAELNKELRLKYNPDGSELRKAQLRMLEMLLFIDKVCTENGITYWLDSGTLIGAARHGGYIPWDDDTDICMPAEDCRKFKRVMLSSKYKDCDFILQCDETDPHFYSPWDVLRDKKSEYVQNSPLHNMRKYKGLQVDIFCQDDKEFEFFRKKMQIFYLKMVKRVIGSSKIIARILRPFLPLTYFFFKRVMVPSLHVIHFKKHDYYRMPYGAEFNSIRYKKNVFPLKRIEFEGKSFNAPGNVDHYLRDIYGNWEQVPDVNHIQTHNVEVKFF